MKGKATRYEYVQKMKQEQVSLERNILSQKTW